jgi:hypothetical protein
MIDLEDLVRNRMEDVTIQLLARWSPEKLDHNTAYAKAHTALLYASFGIDENDERFSDAASLNTVLKINANDYQRIRLRVGNNMIFLNFSKESGAMHGNEHQDALAYFQNITSLQKIKDVEKAKDIINDRFYTAEKILEKHHKSIVPVMGTDYRT